MVMPLSSIKLISKVETVVVTDYICADFIVFLSKRLPSVAFLNPLFPIKPGAETR